MFLDCLLAFFVDNIFLNYYMKQELIFIKNFIGMAAEIYQYVYFLKVG